MRNYFTSGSGYGANDPLDGLANYYVELDATDDDGEITGETVFTGLDIDTTDDDQYEKDLEDGYDAALKVFLSIPLNRDNDGLGGEKSSASSGSVGMNARTDTNNDGDIDDDDDVTYSGSDNFRSTVKTNRSGVAKQAYRRDSNVAQHEQIGAVYAVGKRDGAITEPNEEENDTEDEDGVVTVDGKRDGAITERNEEMDDIHGDADVDTPESDNMNHYWATGVDGSAGGAVLVADTDANTIVIDTRTDAEVQAEAPVKPELAKYDSNDQFNHRGDGVKMDVFEDGLKEKATKGGPVDIDLASDPEPGVNKFDNTNPEAAAPTADTCHD